MAFFKFRQRGQPQDPPPSRAAEPAASPQETVGNLRRRALHRLIGAGVLVVVAVIGFPLLFDTQPRPVALNVPITIPDRQSAPPLRTPPPASSPADAAASAPAIATPPETAASVAQRPQAPASAVLPDASRAAAPASPARPAVAAVAPAASATSAADERREPASADGRRAAEQERARRDAEAAHVLALLNGQNAPPAPPAPPASAKAGRFIIQVGAFADAGKARQARQQAERAGLKTYVQVVDTKDGKRTRVRLGPYASRAEAEHAAAALRKAGLSGTIVAL